MTWKLYFMAIEVGPLFNRKHNMDRMMMLRASNQVLCNVIILFLWHDIIHWIIASSYDKIGFDISCKLSPEETVCMKFQILFSGKNLK